MGEERECGGFGEAVHLVGEGVQEAFFDGCEELLAEEGVSGGVGEVGGCGDVVAKFGGPHGLAVVGGSIDGGDSRVGGGDGLECKQIIETLEADGEHAVAVRTIADVRVDSDGVGVEFALEDGEGSVGGDTNDRGEDRLREGGLDGVRDVHGERRWEVGKAE